MTFVSVTAEADSVPAGLADAGLPEDSLVFIESPVFLCYNLLNVSTVIAGVSLANCAYILLETKTVTKDAASSFIIFFILFLFYINHYLDFPY